MPEIYEKIKKDAIKKGMTEDNAQEKAAKIYNWLRRMHPSMAKLNNKKGTK